MVISQLVIVWCAMLVIVATAAIYLIRNPQLARPVIARLRVQALQAEGRRKEVEMELAEMAIHFQDTLNLNLALKQQAERVVIDARIVGEAQAKLLVLCNQQAKEIESLQRTIGKIGSPPVSSGN